MRKFDKIAFVASENSGAESVQSDLTKRHKGVGIEEADVIVALGGDGLMLETLHKVMGKNIPIFGMNFGSIGFLMNRFDPENLSERLSGASLTLLHPLRMIATNHNGERFEAVAINEVSLLRQTAQAAKLEISVDGRKRLDELVCDGVLLATPAGSTAYNLSAHGPILPITASLMALTPISAFRPRRWRGALLSNRARVKISALESEKRPISAVADHSEFRNIQHVEIFEDRSLEMFLLFDKDHGLDERILTEQFTP